MVSVAHAWSSIRFRPSAGGNDAPWRTRTRRFGLGAVRGGVAVLVLVGIWQAIVTVAAPPHFLLPAPAAVAQAFRDQAGFLAGQAAVTLAEMALGLLLGAAVGVASATAIAVLPLAARLLTPVLVASQVFPVFALAPLLVLWLGYGMLSKVVMAAIIIYFPVASSLVDGLNRTDPGLLDLTRLGRAGRWRALALVRFPAALPALVSGLRVAAVVAPIGAIIGEWVGAAAGLGFVMTQANARMDSETLFAALAILAVAALLLRAAVDALTRPLIAWAEAPDTQEEILP